MLELSIVVPSFNERDNVHELISRLDDVLDGVGWEVVYVDDDSPDGTAELVRSIAREDTRVRCVQRIGRRGLSRAVVEGVLASSARYIVVMDADLQHDETLLPRMLEKAIADDLEFVVGSRYCDGGSIGEWDRKRAVMSSFATRLAKSIVATPLTDPMSGFFLVRRDAFDRAVKHLSGEGYKILLDLFASSPRPPRYAELPFTFRSRFAGTSKLDSAVLWQYVMLILDKRFGRFIPPRLILFSLVGGSGLVVHFIFLFLMFEVVNAPFPVAQSVATLTAMTSNYVLNNFLTYSDRRLKGLRFFTGLLSFYLVCGVGAIANVGVAGFVFQEQQQRWWVAGLAGVLVGTIWNYVATAMFTWRQKR